MAASRSTCSRLRQGTSRSASGTSTTSLSTAPPRRTRTSRASLWAIVSRVILRVARETSHWSGVPEPSTTISPRPQRPLINTQLERRSTG